MNCWSLYIKKGKCYLDIRSCFEDIIRIMDTVKNVVRNAEEHEYESMAESI